MIMAGRKTRKNNRNNGSNTNRNNSQQSAAMNAKAPEMPATQLQDALAEMLEESKSVVPEGVVTAVSAEPMPAEPSLDKFWEMVKATRANYEAAEKRAVARESEAERRYQELDACQAKLDKKQNELSDRESELQQRLELVDQREQASTAREVSLLAQEEDLKQREIDAQAGFIQQRRASLVALAQSVADLHEELTRTEQAIAEERANWLQERKREAERLRNEMEAQLRDREQELEERERVLRSELGELAKRARRVQLDENALAEDRAALEERVEQQVVREVERIEHQLQSLQERLDHTRRDREDLERRLQQREEADRRFGQRTPEQVLDELQRLQEKNGALQTALAARLDEDAAERLRALEAERSDWLAERAAMQRRVTDAEQALAKLHIAATEMETLRDLKLAAEARNKVLVQANRELRTEVDQLIEREDEKVPFPACTAFDATEYQVPVETSPDIGKLADFVADLQQRMAYDPDPERRRYYDLADLRCFLGGLAMGPLMLIQGISGTGKTSLPRAFARAVGTEFQDDDNLIEVQAGWRDPQDLVGHYNAFEKRFYEQKFLRALYRAATPRWQDQIHVIILDEMNLSHPEQYFSDMLSTLEKDADKRFIELTHGAKIWPRLFEEGRRFKIPPNVWFVGTANHDETTKDFADKTYDRALVMEFNHKPTPFEAVPPSPRQPVSYAALRRVFKQAQKKHKQEAEAVSQFLDRKLRNPLLQSFGIGWGQRFEDQLGRYCPVVVAAGGSVSEAADHLLATRLLRKLKDRHDNTQSRLERLRDRITESWPILDAQTPVKSLTLLKGELARFDVESEEAA